MHTFFHLTVKGANPHHLAVHRLEALQELVTDLGAEAFPLFLKLASGARRSVQPVVSGALLAEVDTFAARLEQSTVPCLYFRNQQGALMGGLYAPPAQQRRQAPRGEVLLEPTEAGIRAEAALFPPPVGFRSRPGLPTGHYECFFQRIEWQNGQPLGWRTMAMSGSGAPVPLSELRLPPATQWDFAYVSGKPAVAMVEVAMVPFSTAFEETLHGIRSACEDSLRLREPMELYRD